MCVCLLAARCARSFAFRWPPKIRGRGEDRVRAAPAVSQACCKEIGCPRAYRFSGEHPAFPAQWLYGLYEIVLVTLLFVTPSPCEAFASSRVDACIGASDPNDFTVRKNPSSPKGYAGYCCARL